MKSTPKAQLKHAVDAAGALDPRQLGEYIREQRRDSNVSLRQLAKLAGVSNPYLSQIERGLRKPSAEILQQIAKALRISAEALYVQAGILEQREGDGVVADAVLADDGLTERQKQVLLEIYDSFRRENAAAASSAPAASTPRDDDSVAVTVVTTAGSTTSGSTTSGSTTSGSTTPSSTAPGSTAPGSAEPAAPVPPAG